MTIHPQDAIAHSLLAVALSAQEKYKEAVREARTGAGLAPDLPYSHFALAITLFEAERLEDARSAIKEAIRLDPEEARYYGLLSNIHPKKALVHFRKALRLNPTLTWAKSGLVEALKAHNPVYRVMLRYFLWMSRLDNNTRWAIVLGAVFASRFARGLLATSPGLAPVIQPLLYLYLAFVFLTWTAPSLFNLLLRLNRFGRLALSREQTIASNWVGLCILAALVAFSAGLLLGGADQGALNEAAVASLALIIPVAGVFQANPGKNRAILILWTLALGAVIAGGLYLALTSAPGNPWSLFFLLGLVAYSWVANAIISMER